MSVWTELCRLLKMACPHGQQQNYTEFPVQLWTGGWRASVLVKVGDRRNSRQRRKKYLLIYCCTVPNWLIDNHLSCLQNVIFVDGHSSHTNNLDLLLECNASGRDIKSMCLQAGQTSKLQPLDKCVFGGIKSRWYAHLRILHTNSVNDLPEVWLLSNRHSIVYFKLSHELKNE